MIRVADYIMQRIYEEGVKHLFYVAGGQCAYLTDALRRYNEDGRLKAIAVHHEQTAAMAALSYSQYNENLGACLVTTGCAGTNTMTGLLHAYQDSIPCIFVSGQQNVNQTIQSSGLPLRQVGVQETDIVKLVSPITKYATMITNSEDIAWEMDKAIQLARRGRKGPVWIDVPLDIQNQRIDETKLRRYEEKEENKSIDRSKLENVFEMIKDAKRPVILAGQGIRFSKARIELKEFVEKIQIPVVFTRNSIDLIETEHELNFGVLGSFGANRYANFVVQNSDLLLSIGSRLSTDTTGPEYEKFAREAKIIAVDIDKVEHQKKGVKLDLFIHADAKDFLSEMLKKNFDKVDDNWLETCKHWKEVFPDFKGSRWDASNQKEENNHFDLKYFLNTMSKYFPENTTIVSDAGMTAVATPANCRFKESDRSIHSFAQGEMGFSLPGAIGVACASEGPVVAMTGDGSFMMNLQEIQTVVRNQFNLKIIINNNNGYSGVRHGHKATFRGKTMGVDSQTGIDFPDYEKIAAAFGVKYCCIENDQCAEEKLKEVFSSNQPYLCEVMCDPNQYDLHNAFVMYGKRQFGFRPIEDQSPFIDRETFFKEMIVEPIEESSGKPM